MTDAAAAALGLADAGLAHHEEYPDVGQVPGRILEFGEPAPEGVPTRPAGQ